MNTPNVKDHRAGRTSPRRSKENNMRWTKEQQEGFGNLLYFLQKNFCNQANYSELLKDCGLTYEDWEEIKLHLEHSYGIKLYV
jgi:hypothetical protein